MPAAERGPAGAAVPPDRRSKPGAEAWRIAGRPSVPRVSERLNAELEVVVRGLRRIARGRRGQRSRLDRYRAEIESLVSAGASSYDIALWLQKFKLTRVPP